jgi:hypothetical protein
MRHQKIRWAASATFLILVATTPAFGGVIGTTNLGGSNPQLLNMNPTGQSFTAVDPTVDWVSFHLYPLNPTFLLDGIKVTLYEGNGFEGAVLASDTEYPSAGYLGWYQFDLGGVSVTPGQKYTLRLEVTGGSPYWGATVAYWVPDAYPGGDHWQFNYEHNPIDFAFQVSGTPVPDPGSTLLLFGMGVAGLVAVRRPWLR